MTQSQNRAKLVVSATVVLVLVWLTVTAWMRPLMLPDEGRYVGVAWEMVRSGDWLTPTLNGLPYFHKPPLFYWITATSLWLFGNHEWAARFASLVGAAVGSLACYGFFRRWLSNRVGQMGLIVLMAQPLWMIAAQFANLDMLVAGCIVATICLLAHSVLLSEQAQPFRGALAAGWGMAALGILAKGLIGFVLPAMVITVWLVAQKKWRRLFGLLAWPGVLLVLLLTVPWCAAMQHRFPDFLDYFFVVQHFKRFTESGFNNVMPLWFYPAVLALAFLPWLPWIVRASKASAESSDTQNSLRLLLLIWAAVIVVFFSLPRSKLLGYVLPAVAPLAMLAAQGYVGKGRLSGRKFAAGSLVAGLGVALTLSVLTWLAVHPQHSMRSFGQAFKEGHHPSELVVMLEKYYFDFPFYAGLSKPVAVFEKWDDPELHRQDNQRKEIADAGLFDRASAAKYLLLPAFLPQLLCSSDIVWLLGPTAAVERYPYLKQAVSVHHLQETTLWRIETRTPVMSASLGCAETPNSGSPSTSSQPLL